MEEFVVEGARFIGFESLMVEEGGYCGVKRARSRLHVTKGGLKLDILSLFEFTQHSEKWPSRYRESDSLAIPESRYCAESKSGEPENIKAASKSTSNPNRRRPFPKFQGLWSTLPIQLRLERRDPSIKATVQAPLPYLSRDQLYQIAQVFDCVTASQKSDNGRISDNDSFLSFFFFGHNDSR